MKRLQARVVEVVDAERMPKADGKGDEKGKVAATESVIDLYKAKSYKLRSC